MKEKHKKTIFVLVGISFLCSLLSDLIYGKISFAQEYMVGKFLSEISSLTMSFAFVLILLYLVLRVCFKDMFEMMFNIPYQYSKPKRRTRNAKPKR